MHEDPTGDDGSGIYVIIQGEKFYCKHILNVLNTGSGGLIFCECVLILIIRNNSALPACTCIFKLHWYECYCVTLRLVLAALYVAFETSIIL